LTVAEITNPDVTLAFASDVGEERLPVILDLLGQQLLEILSGLSDKKTGMLRSFDIRWVSGIFILVVNQAPVLHCLQGYVCHPNWLVALAGVVDQGNKLVL